MLRKSVRLSGNIMPKKYEIELKPDLLNFTFSGRETISLIVSKPTKKITLHAKEIEIDTADIIIENASSASLTTGKIFGTITYDEKFETATFTFPKLIPAGRIKLTLVFRGILNDKMRGFYRSHYTIGKERYHMATTQFEATDARRAFPCFDEPARKAIFHISLVVPKGKTAISNTLPLSIREHESGYDIVKFSPTPKMSTYLLAFIVGDLEYIEKKSSRGVIVRVYTIPGKKHQAKFALDVTVRILEFYEKYFDIRYPLNTLDMIAIPDFSSLAMENWGAITFREVGLLADEKHTSTGSKEMIVEVIAHELAHQWFGNLVTMEWWTHLWLNEGFASYISYVAIDTLYPSWDIWTRFSTDTQGGALRLDALRTTHPIEVKVRHPDEIGEIFDEISYSKGASVIRMLADYLGKKDFRDGLRHYLKKHSYKNTETVHLWQAFEKVSRKPVAAMMHNWTSKPGYPVVRINNDLTISQERFFANPASKSKNKDTTIWKVPISFVNEKKFTKLNFGEAGFYRVAYSKQLLEKLMVPVRDKTLSPRDRLGIVRDLFALSEAGTIPTTDALEFLKAFKGEDNYTVWVEIATGLAKLEQLLAKSPAKENLNAFILGLFSPVASRLGWTPKKNETHSDVLLRSLAISRAGRAGDKKIIREARKKFLMIQRGGHVSPDIRGAIYAITATWGGIKEFSAFIDMYKNESLHEEKNRIGGALGNFMEAKILEKVCEFAMSKHVRFQDTVGILSGVGANPLGRDIWWRFIRTNWQTLVSRYGEGGLTLGRAVKAIGGSAEQKHFQSIKKFFATHQAPGAARAIEQLLERLEGNILWLKRDGKVIGKFLSTN